MRKLMMAATFALPLLGGSAMAQETLKIGYIDPLSGGGASVGEVGLKTFQYLADEVNAKGGIAGKKVDKQKKLKKEKKEKKKFRKR